MLKKKCFYLFLPNIAYKRFQLNDQQVTIITIYTYVDHVYVK